MTFKEQELSLIDYICDLALAELHNKSATCPDVFKYAEELEELEQIRTDVVNLQAKVLRELGEPE